MRTKTNKPSPVMRLKLFAVLFTTAIPALASAAWQVVASEPGKRVEIDRSSIFAEAGGMTTVNGRIVLDKPIVDPKTSSAYRIIEVSNRYSCSERTQATMKRSYFKDEGELLRQEEVKIPFAMPVRSGTPDDRLLREVCRPKPATATAAAAIDTADKVSAVAGELRKANDALIAKEVKKDLGRLTSPPGSSRATHARSVSLERKKPVTASPLSIAWSYEGQGGTANWARLKTAYATCAAGQRQSPIDLRDGIAVDLEPIRFVYNPAAFRVVDSGLNLQVAVYGGGINLVGKNFDLNRIQFHRPAEITIDGQTFDMDAQLVHKSEDGKLAILTVLLEQGTENTLVQKVLNNLPLEKGGEVAPPGQSLDVNDLLPVNRRYFTFMGSLTTPPCTEDVLWLVLRQPQLISPEQLLIFQRLYKPNARPVQPGFGRIIKESR